MAKQWFGFFAKLIFFIYFNEILAQLSDIFSHLGTQLLKYLLFKF